MAVKYSCGGCGLSLTVESELPNPICPKCRAALVGEVVEASTVKVARPVMMASGGRGTGSFTSGLSTTSTKELSSIKATLSSREAEVEKLRQELSAQQSMAEAAMLRLEEETRLRTETAGRLKAQEQLVAELKTRQAEWEKLKGELEARKPVPALPAEIDAAVRQSAADVTALRLLLDDAKASVATQERMFLAKMEAKEAEVSSLRQRLGSGAVNLTNTSNSDDRELAGRKAALAAQVKQRAWTMIQNGTLTLVVFVFMLFLVIMQPDIKQNGSVLFLAWLILIVDVVAMVMFIRELMHSYEKGRRAVAKGRERQAAQIATVTGKAAAEPPSESDAPAKISRTPKPENAKLAAFQEAMKRRQQGKK
jgi:hypothetical protein